MMDGRRRTRWGLLAALGLTGLVVSTLAVGTASAEPVASFLPHAPARLLDTRPFGQTVDGIGQGSGQLAVDQVTEVTVGGRAGVPIGAPAAALTFTITAPSAAGFLTVWPCGTARPNASLSNFGANETIAATTLLGLSSLGKVCAASSVPTHLIVDAAGHQPLGGDFVGVVPARLLDTRSAGSTIDGLQSGGGPVAAGSTTHVPVAGRGGVAFGAAMAYLTVTLVGLQDAGFATVHPCTLGRPNVSTVNVSAGRASANTTVVAIAGQVDICVYSSTRAQVIVDVVGFERAFSALDTADAHRALDTRGSTRLGTTPRRVALGLDGPKMPNGVGSVVLNATAVRASEAGFVTIYPPEASGTCAGQPPTASVVNFAKDQTIADLVLSGVGSDAGGDEEHVCAYSSVPTDFLLDVVAFSPSDGALVATISPSKDTYVDASTPTSAHGEDSVLVADADPVRESLLSFDLKGTLGASLPRTATLRLHVAPVSATIPDPGSTSGGTVSLLTDAGPWDEAVNYGGRPLGTRTLQATIGAVVPGQWVEVDVTAAAWRAVALGAPMLDVVVSSADTNGAHYSSSESDFPPQLLVTAADRFAGPVVAAVGDMACVPGATSTAAACQHLAVADRIYGDPSVTALLALGDLQYPAGSLADFNGSYRPAYGRFADIVHPVPGNHEYGTTGAAGYFGYFGALAGDPTKGYYSFTSGDWLFIALNTNLSCSTISCASGSPQEQFARTLLTADRADRRPCTIAYWHHPRFSSDTTHGDDPNVQALWADMQLGADIVLNGHVHTYERFDPLDATGQLATDGVRQFIVGTGGFGHYANGTPKTGSVVRLADQFGYLRIATFPHAYRWEFIATTGQILDSGTDTCRR
jgi:acid phosphatase type 7